ncbi:MAG: hypothetical protein ACRDPR_11295 [Nocardioidaceae bacterium]
MAHPDFQALPGRHDRPSYRQADQAGEVLVLPAADRRSARQVRRERSEVRSTVRVADHLTGGQ